MFAALFPGQGSHGAGDRLEVARLAPDLLEQCVAAVGEDPFPRIAERTRFAQPALFVTGIARWRASGLPAMPGAFAGHSLGELTALTAAGALSFEDGLALVVERGRLMDAAQAGGMVVLRAPADEAQRLAAKCGVVVANDNAPGQIVCSGSVDGIGRLIAAADEAGRPAIRLPVTGAFHSPLMADAAASFASTLESVDFHEPIAPVWCCATAAPFEDPRRQLAEALTSPVRWRELLLAMEGRGFDAFADVGPGRVLDGLVRRTLPNATRVEVSTDVVA